MEGGGGLVMVARSPFGMTLGTRETSGCDQTLRPGQKGWSGSGLHSARLARLKADWSLGALGPPNLSACASTHHGLRPRVQLSPNPNRRSAPHHC